MSDAATVFAIYRFRPDVADSTIADLLSRHRTALEQSGLVTDTLPTVVKSLQNNAQHRDFIEIFEWKSAEAPGSAHSDAGVRQIWQEFESLTSVPAVALGQLAEAAHPFAHFAPFGVTYESAKAAKRPKPARKTRKTTPAPMRAKAAAKRHVPKAKRHAPKASKARGRRRVGSKR